MSSSVPAPGPAEIFSTGESWVVENSQTHTLEVFAGRRAFEQATSFAHEHWDSARVYFHCEDPRRPH